MFSKVFENISIEIFDLKQNKDLCFECKDYWHIYSKKKMKTTIRRKVFVYLFITLKKWIPNNAMKTVFKQMIAFSEVTEKFQTTIQYFKWQSFEASIINVIKFHFKCEKKSKRSEGIKPNACIQRPIYLTMTLTTTNNKKTRAHFSPMGRQ